MIVFGLTFRDYLMVFFSSGSQCWFFSHEPSSLFHRSVLVIPVLEPEKSSEARLGNCDPLVEH